MSLINEILAKRKLAMEDQGPEVIDGTGDVMKPKNDSGNATIDPKAGGKPNADSPEVKDRPAGAKVDPDAPATVDSPADAGIDAGSANGKGKGDPAHTTDSADLVSTEDATEVPEEVATELATATDVANDPLESDLTDAEDESESLSDEMDEIGETEEVNDSLEETVTAMEALIESGSVTKAELMLVTGRAQRALSRLELPMVGFSSESTDSEEGRMEALRLSHEDLKEKVDRIGTAIKNSYTKLKERFKKFISENLSFHGRCKARLEHCATALEALGKAEAKVTTISVPRSIHRYLTDASGKNLEMVGATAKIAKVAKTCLTDWPTKAAASYKQGKLPPLSESLFAGLPGGLTVKLDNNSPTFTLAAASNREDRKGVAVLKVDQLKKIIKSLQEAMAGYDAFNVGVLDRALNNEDGADKEHFNMIWKATMSMFDLMFYVLRASAAISSFVALEIKQYGVKAPA